MQSCKGIGSDGSGSGTGSIAERGNTIEKADTNRGEVSASGFRLHPSGQTTENKTWTKAALQIALFSLDDLPRTGRPYL
jgi:hypothetical protein